MNYQESKVILEEIKKNKKILINCHRNPDADSIGSALSFWQVLTALDKKVKIICPTKIPIYLDFLPGFDKILTVDFTSFAFSSYDLFLTLDSSGWEMVSNSKTLKICDIPIISIDHHKTNSGFALINLVDEKSSSTAEIAYKIFQDWRVEINQKIATCLLTGIIGDTGAFSYPEVSASTLKTASFLIDKGADKNRLIRAIYRTNDLNTVHFWAEILKRMRLEAKERFCWSAIPYKIFKKHGSPKLARELAANFFLQAVSGTDFGVIIVEEELGKISVSLRSRTGFDVSEIAMALGGGGHVYAAGAKIEVLDFSQAIKKVIGVCKKYASKD